MLSSSGVSRKPKDRLPLDSGRVVTVDSIGNVIQAYRVKNQVYFSKSTDGGKSFGAKVKVGDSSIFPAGGERLYLQALGSKNLHSLQHILLLSWVLSRSHPESTFGAVYYFSTDDGLHFTLDRFFGEKRPVPGETTHTSIGGITNPFQDAMAKNSPTPDYIEPPQHGHYAKPPDIKGDIEGDLLATPMDVAYLANNIFFGKPFPSRIIRLRNKALNPPDVNCDGRISPADLVVELRAVFLGTNVSCP